MRVRSAARSGEWAQHFSNASCYFKQFIVVFGRGLYDADSNHPSYRGFQAIFLVLECSRFPTSRHECKQIAFCISYFYQHVLLLTAFLLRHIQQQHSPFYIKNCPKRTGIGMRVHIPNSHRPNFRSHIRIFTTTLLIRNTFSNDIVSRHKMVMHMASV